MTIKRLFTVLYTVIILVVFALVGLVLALQSVLQKVEASQANRYYSYLLADELRQSSDDLTHMVRTYTQTGDPRWEQMYNDIAAIRNGEKPRPQGYDRIYWDFVAASGKKPTPDGEKVALRTLMEQAGFTAEELARLDESAAKSDALIVLETKAMNAVKGLYPDENGNYTVQGEPDQALAQSLVFSQDYYNEKALIMRPLNDFFDMIDARTQSAIQVYQKQAATLVWVIIANALLLVVLSVFAFFTIHKRVSAPLE